MIKKITMSILVLIVLVFLICSNNNNVVMAQEFNDWKPVTDENNTLFSYYAGGIINNDRFHYNNETATTIPNWKMEARINDNDPLEEVKLGTVVDNGYRRVIKLNNQTPNKFDDMKIKKLGTENNGSLSILQRENTNGITFVLSQTVVLKANTNYTLVTSYSGTTGKSLEVKMSDSSEQLHLNSAGTGNSEGMMITTSNFTTKTSTSITITYTVKNGGDVFNLWLVRAALITREDREIQEQLREFFVLPSYNNLKMEAKSLFDEKMVAIENKLPTVNITTITRNFVNEINYIANCYTIKCWSI